MDADFSQMTTFLYWNAFIPQMTNFQIYIGIQKFYLCNGEL